MINLHKVEIHHLFHEKKLGLVEIARMYDIPPTEVMKHIVDVSKQREVFNEWDKKKFRVKAKAGGKWVFENKNRKPRKFIQTMEVKTIPKFDGLTVMSLAFEKAKQK